MKDDRAERLADALAYHRVGDFETANHLYDSVLRDFPDHPDVQHHAGVFRLQRGRWTEAVELLRDAVKARPNVADYQASLGTAYAQLRQCEEARSCFARALELDGRHADAHFNLGNLMRLRSRHEEATRHFEQATQVRPAWPEAWFNLANTLRDRGDPEGAARAYRQALQHRPNYLKALNNLGNLFKDQGNCEEAIRCYESALRFDANYSEARINLGVALRQQGRTEDAIECLRESTLRAPDHAEAQFRLGAALKAQGRHKEALACFERAVALDAQLPEPHLELGIDHKEHKRYREAVACFENALRKGCQTAAIHMHLGDALRGLQRFAEAHQQLDLALQQSPCSPTALNLKGVVLFAEGRVEESIDYYEQTLTLAPDNFEAHNNLGAALLGLQRFEDALASFERALRIKPDFGICHLNRALAWLRHGHYEAGWLEFEWRRVCEPYRLRNYGKPFWDGRPFPGQTLLLHAEQGLGDTFQFARFIAAAKRLGGDIVLEAQRAACPLLAGCAGVDRIVPRGEALPEYHFQAPLMSLPGILGLSEEQSSMAAPYLHPAPEVVDYWRKKLNSHAGFKIGIAWQGNKKYPADHLRSIALRYYEPLAKVPGVQLFALQKGEGTEQIAQVAERFHVSTFGEELDTQRGPFMDTAAIASLLDLVITSDTSLAHLAGALGAPVWVALPCASDWRWSVDREDCRWYPTMRLFRQGHPDGWPEVFERMAGELHRVTLGQASKLPPAARAPVRVETPVSVGELLDKLTILELKRDKITDPTKRQNVLREWRELDLQCRQKLSLPPEAQALVDDLRRVNGQLWDVEDRLRVLEAAQTFDADFITLARSVYRLNDQRASLKRQINQLVGSELCEEKSYANSAKETHA